MIPLKKELPNFKFPPFDIKQFNNIETLIYNDNELPIICIKIILPLGASEEKTPGSYTLFTKMLRRGTKSMSASQYSYEIDQLGANISISCNWDAIIITGNCLSQYANKVFKLMTEALIEPRFDPKELKKLKQKQIAELDQEKSELSYLSNLAFNSSLFANTIYGHSILGNAKDIKDFSLDECKEIHNKILKSFKPSLIFSGDFKDNLIPIIDSFSKNFETNIQIKRSENINVENISKVSVINKSGANQVSLKIGKLSIDRTNPDYAGVNIVNTIYGGYFLSRLNELLRETKGLTYGVSSYLQNRRLASFQTISASLNDKFLLESINDIKIELDKIGNDKIDIEEFERAKNYMTGSFLRHVETIYQISSMLSNLIILGLPFDYYQNYYNELKNIELDNINLIKPKYFSSESLVIAISGNMKNIKSQLKKIENFQEYTNDFILKSK